MAEPLTIDPEFAALCGKLSAEELSLLEAGIERDGCLDPIIVWDDTILDGHHRYEICTRTGATFKTKAIKLDSRADAIEWIACHQLGRRNASDEVRSYLRGKRYRAEKKQGERTDLTSGHFAQKSTASEKLAAEYGVDEKTIRRDADFAVAVDALAENVGPAVKSEILSGALSKKDVVAIAELPAREQKKAIAAAQNGQSPLSQPAVISETFYKSLKGLAERIEGIREQYGTAKEMFQSAEWDGCDTQFVIELVGELRRMFTSLDKEMREYGKDQKAKLQKGSGKRSKATA